MIDGVFHFVQTTGGYVFPLFIQNAIYATILFAVIWMIQKVLRIRSPYFQAGLWILLFIRLVLPPDWSLPFSGRSLIDHIFPRQTIGLSHVPESFESDDHGTILSGSNSLSINLQKRLNAHAVVFSLWILGVAFFFSMYMKRLSRYRRLIRSARRIGSGEAVEILQTWRRRFNIRRPVRLMTRSCTVSPFTLGVFRPVILLPEKIFDPAFRDDIESVIAHELAHIKRWDDLWIRLQNFIQVVYFFHPLVWIAGSRLQLARECACDSLVLSEQRIDRVRYGRGLLNILKMQPFGPDCVALIPSFTSERNKLITRFKTMKGAQTMRKKHKAGLVVLLAGLALFVLPMAAVPLPEKSMSDKDSSSTSALVTVDETSVSSLHLIMPVKGGRIVDGFGIRLDPIRKDVGQFHKGIDIPEKKGTPVLATADGNVSFVTGKDYDRRGYGKYIILQHPGGFETVYSQLDSILVQNGVSVKQGEVIGQVGQSGRSTGPHLHFEVRLDGKAVDPEKYLEK